jgi:hypothetical protein
VGALLTDLGPDPVDVEVDVDAVGDGLGKVYSDTRFWWKKAKVCLPGVAVRPMTWASKYSRTPRQTP